MDIIFEIKQCSNLLFQAGAGTIELVNQSYHDLHVCLNDNIQLLKVLLQLLNGTEEPLNFGLPFLRRVAKRWLIINCRHLPSQPVVCHGCPSSKNYCSRAQPSLTCTIKICTFQDAEREPSESTHIALCHKNTQDFFQGPLISACLPMLKKNEKSPCNHWGQGIQFQLTFNPKSHIEKPRSKMK